MKTTVRRMLAAVALLQTVLLAGCGTGAIGQAVSMPDSFADTTLTSGQTTTQTEQTEQRSLTGQTDASAESTETAEQTTAQTEQTTTASTTASATASATTVSQAASSTTASATTTTVSRASGSSGSTASQTTGTVGSSATTVTTAATTEQQGAVTTNAYGKYTLSAEDQAFLKQCVFVGDSICYGLEVYKLLPDNNVLATGCVAARSINDYTFKINGKSYGYVQGLSILKPKYVIFSMGMNDINITSAAKYCENYKNLLAAAQAALPDSKLYVASITPISNNIKFSTNTKIDTYNQTIKEYLATNYPAWGFVDVAPRLKNQYNGLISNYSSGDGIHLSPAAYTAYLLQVCEQLNR